MSYNLMNPVNNVVYVDGETGTILTIFRNQHVVDGYRLHTVIDEGADHIEVYTETLPDLCKRYDLDKDEIVKTFKMLDNTSEVITGTSE